MIEGTKRKVDGRIYELWDQYPTMQKANGIKRWLLRSGNATHAFVSKAPREGEEKPFRVWIHSDPAISWKNAVSEGVLKKIDREIAPLVKDLNANGIYTVESCSGHKEEHAMLWILKEGFSQEKFLRIMARHGMKNVLRRRQYSDSSRGVMFFTFDLPGPVAYKQDRSRIYTEAKKKKPAARATGLLWKPVRLV